MIWITAAQPLDGYNVRLQFNTGEVKDVDLEPFLRGPIFDPMRSDPNCFRAVRVDEELGTIVWDNGADIDPDVLHGDRQPAWASELPPATIRP